ncbi:helix-turn-helix transcriptional regulator [Niastella caeni]|uniref:Helix-turn-helix transcriptional regulator n=1 Tax=Niastella caeni TaxID=2569763 RepID=A0A4S8HSQ2_9BACT|nr:helix-turn-helix transcriptional regulator [Niastella caeni]THU37004.1 helix-turn-helix transcriptional regulator [Niastella caeni]
MIKNEKQYRISKKLLNEINENIDNLKKDTTQHPLKIKLMLASALNMQKEIEQDLLLYETLKTDKIAILRERLVADLPSLLTEYKIKSGLTQKEFAAQLGIKEQQLQRYEADNFRSVTFKNLLRFLDAVGLEITIKETRMTRTNKNNSRKKQSR